MKEYYLGLDIGTNSVGWAVTDSQYNIIKHHGKALWGTHQFPEGKTAEDRRLHRSSRRRRMRQTQRIKLLDELFAEEISKIDPLFFERLAESKYHLDDKTVKQPYALFNDKEYTDKQYYKDYPTIFHLRKTLINKDKKHDIRLIYLAIHHIMKNRGHFLFTGNNMQEISELQPVFNQLTQYIKDNLDIDYSCPEQKINTVGDILKSKKLGIKDKQRKLYEILPSVQTQQKAVTKLITGATVSIQELFLSDDDLSNDESLIYDDGKPYKISFKNDNYEEKREQLVAIIEEDIELIDNAKAVYDWALLADILQGKQFISEAQVWKYEKHREDLRNMRDIFRTHLTKDDYKKVFYSDPGKGKHNYVSYIGAAKNKKSTQRELCQDLLKIITEKSCGEHPKFEYVCEELKNNTFLPKPISADNAVIPYQLHLKELEIILDNASKHYGFLNQADDSGLTVKDKIIKIFAFRIPFYVGPLNDAHKNKSGNCWIVKRPGMDGIPIRPWNFEEIVDKNACRNEFIVKMTNRCTYLIGEKVLPKNSLLYSEYMVLNELNNLVVDGSKITPEIKQKIFTDLYMKQKRVTISQLKQHMINEGIINKDTIITGYDQKLKNNLSSYCELANILGKNMDADMAEDIIRCLTICGKDKDLACSYIEDRYPDLDKKIVDKLASLNYTGWGRFSKKFLTGITHNLDDRSIMHIISGLKNTEDNLMQLLSSKYSFTQQIEDLNAELACLETTLDDKIDQLNLSPAVKRSLYRTLKITEEITKTMQVPPKKIFIEMARGGGRKKTTKSRQDSLLELYKKCKDDERNWKEEIQGRTASEFNSDRLYLYYTQMGRCMYTGKKISLDDLYDSSLYDIDHIYPRDKVKDDSIDNRVLVNKTFNQKTKSNQYPLPPNTQRENKALWDRLLSMELIKKEKYDRLTRKTKFSEDELGGFIARQLVETRQSSKAVAHILKQIYPDSDVKYVKSGNVSEFRQKMELIKVREINDFHHAKDAYLSVVVGNVYDTKFTHNAYHFIKDDTIKQRYHLGEMYRYDVKRNNFIAWEAGDNGTIKRVRKYMRKNNILVTRYPYEEKNALFDATLVRKPNIIPLKKDPRLADTNKYGGYEGIKIAYYMYVDYLKKDSKKETTRARKLIAVPVYITLQPNIDLIDYCKQKGLDDPIIILPKIRLNTLFNFNGFLMYLSGYHNDNSFHVHQANQLCIDEASELYIKKIIKYLDRVKKQVASIKDQVDKEIKQGEISESDRETEIDKRTDELATSYDGVTKDDNLLLYNLFIHKLSNTIYKERLFNQAETLESKKELFMSLSIYNQCFILCEILKLFQCNGGAANYTLLKGSKEAGKITPSPNIISYKLPETGDQTPEIESHYNYASIIYQSPCGIYTHEVDLLKI